MAGILPTDPISKLTSLAVASIAPSGTLQAAAEAMTSEELGLLVVTTGKDDGSVLIVSVDGGCPGVENVKSGVIGATSQQYPLKMAAMALEAIASGEIPAIDPAVGFLDTGATLITDKPVEGVESIDTAQGLELCWG